MGIKIGQYLLYKASLVEEGHIFLTFSSIIQDEMVKRVPKFDHLTIDFIKIGTENDQTLQ